MSKKHLFTRLMSLAVLVLPLSAAAQWTNHYPLAEGFDLRVYLEGYELPVLSSGPMDPAPSPAGDAIAFTARG